MSAKPPPDRSRPRRSFARRPRIAPTARPASRGCPRPPARRCRAACPRSRGSDTRSVRRANKGPGTWQRTQPRQSAARSGGCRQSSRRTHAAPASTGKDSSPSGRNTSERNTEPSASVPSCCSPGSDIHGTISDRASKAWTAYFPKRTHPPWRDDQALLRDLTRAIRSPVATWPCSCSSLGDHRCPDCCLAWRGSATRITAVAPGPRHPSGPSGGGSALVSPAGAPISVILRPGRAEQRAGLGGQIELVLNRRMNRVDEARTRLQLGRLVRLSVEAGELLGGLEGRGL